MSDSEWTETATGDASLRKRIQELESLLAKSKLLPADDPDPRPAEFQFRHVIDAAWVPGSDLIGGPDRKVTLTIRGRKIARLVGSKWVVSEMVTLTAKHGEFRSGAFEIWTEHKSDVQRFFVNVKVNNA
jgi:hypothetical protein